MSSRWRPGAVRAIMCAGVTCVMAHAAAQAPALSLAQAPAPPQTPVLRVTTRMVEVSVVVHDRKGASVADLTKDEFQVFDAGEKQQVAMLRVERVTPAAARTAAAPEAEPATATPALPSGTFSNLSMSGVGARAVTVVLMDDINTPFADQAFAHRHLINFLRTLTPTDRIAIYTLGHQLRILHDFTDDAAALFRVLQRHKIYVGPEVALERANQYNTGDEELDAFLSRTDQFVGDMQISDRVRITLGAIEAIARHVAGVPGRKNLVWVSGGFPFAVGRDQFTDDVVHDARTFLDPMEHAARAVSAAQLAIYPVDARALASGPDLMDIAPVGVNGRPIPKTGPSEAIRQAQMIHNSMDVMAQRTGGKAYMSNANLTAAIRGAIDDASVTYVLGYYPTHNAWDGKFRALTVNVTRPGLDVRHRLGYYAFPDEPATEQARNAALTQAATSPIDATGIGLTVRLLRDQPQPGFLRAAITIDPRQVTLQSHGERRTGQIDVRFAMQAKPGAPLMSATQAVRLDLSPQAYEEVSTSGLLVIQDIDLAQCGYRLKVVVRDVASGRIGSVTARIDTLPPSPAR